MGHVAETWLEAADQLDVELAGQRRGARQLEQVVTEPRLVTGEYGGAPGLAICWLSRVVQRRNRTMLHGTLRAHASTNPPAQRLGPTGCSVSAAGKRRPGQAR